MARAVLGFPSHPRQAAPEGESGPTPEAVLAQLERTFASGDFDASPRSRDFLRFVVEQTLAGRAEGLTQVAIATRVFGRRGDFDPTIDPIVRIQAGRLRRSLERYYLLSGARDSIRIELPRGLYAPLFRLAVAAAPAAPRRAADDGWPTVVVHTFGALEGDPALTAAAQRFTEELAGEMGRYRDLRVALRDAARPASGTAFELSGRFGHHPPGLRLAAWLVDGRTGEQVWAQEYADGGLDATGENFGEVARVVAARVASEHGVVAQRLWVEQRDQPGEPATPYDAVLRSYRFFFNRDPADLAPAVAALRQAVAEHPECGLAWVQLSRLCSANYSFDIAPHDRPLETTVVDALACAQRGVLLDPTGQRAGGALALALLLMGELSASRAEVHRALALNPHSLVYLESLAWLLVLLGDQHQAPAMLHASIARNPFHLPVAYMALACHHLRLGEVEQAYECAVRYRDTGYFWREMIRAACLGHLGRSAEAADEVGRLLRARPDFGERGLDLIGRLVRLPDLFERIVSGLSRAGLRLA